MDGRICLLRVHRKHDKLSVKSHSRLQTSPRNLCLFGPMKKKTDEIILSKEEKKIFQNCLTLSGNARGIRVNTCHPLSVSLHISQSKKMRRSKS